jgi:hypothetical protein
MAADGVRAEVRAADLAGATVLTVIEGRWDVTFCLRLADGREVDMVASADRYYTDDSGIWFGTKEEHDAE